MSDSEQVAAFFDEVLRCGEVFGLRGERGVPAPETGDGQRAMPFWSRRSRAERIRATVGAYRATTVFAVPLEQWREQWLTGLASDGLRVGVNWSGPTATGQDLSPDEVRVRLAAPPDGWVSAP